MYGEVSRRRVCGQGRREYVGELCVCGEMYGEVSRACVVGRIECVGELDHHLKDSPQRHERVCPS